MRQPSGRIRINLSNVAGIRCCALVGHKLSWKYAKVVGQQSLLRFGASFMFKILIVLLNIESIALQYAAESSQKTYEVYGVGGAEFASYRSPHALPHYQWLRRVKSGIKSYPFITKHLISMRPPSTALPGLFTPYSFHKPIIRQAPPLHNSLHVPQVIHLCHCFHIIVKIICRFTNCLWSFCSFNL